MFTVSTPLLVLYIDINMNAKYKRNQVHKQESIILPGILLPGDLDSGQARSRYLITSTRLLVQNSYQETKMIIKV